MFPHPSDIQYFLEVAHTNNISRASERLGISQPSLSLAIQRLENQVGTALLVRSKSGVILTKAGERFVSQARKLVEEWENLRSVTQRDDIEVSGRFTLGVHQSVAIYTLNRFLPFLLEEYSGIEVDLVHDLSRKITEGVISYKIDFGIVVNPARHPDLVIKNVLNDEVSFWVGPERTPLNDPKSGKAVLISNPELLQTQSLTRSMKKAQLEFRRMIPSSSLEVITSLVHGGAGVGILPRRVATQIPELKLKPLSGNLPKFKDEICLIYRADFQKTLAAKAVIEVIRTRLQ